MAPNTKRKRGDRTYSQDSSDANGRPSPHRPQNLGLAHSNPQSNARGNRRPSRGGARGGANAPSSPTSTANTQQSPTVMSPPATVPTSAKATSTAAPPMVPSPVSEQQPSHPPSIHTTMSNSCLTGDRVGAWRSNGRQEVIAAAVRAQAEDDSLTLTLIFQELVRAALDKMLDQTEVGAAVHEILRSSHPADITDPVSLFLDTVSSLTEPLKEQPSLRPLLEATGIDPARMRSELETPLLITVPLVRQTFTKMAIRKGTHALYRQSNYNLLREESEGYSKLITEYFTTANSEPPSDVAVAETFQRVKALIGAFDLDVGRVLDITLDVFANLLVKHYKFFIKLLRTSSWWPEYKIPHGVQWEDQGFSSLPEWALPDCPLWYYTDQAKERLLQLREERDRKFWDRVREVGLKAYFEIGGRRITSGHTPQLSNGKMDADSVDTAMNKQPTTESERMQGWAEEWMATTDMLPPPGNRIAAQLLGFKLRFYASDARDAHDTLPDNLIYLAALLIKIGFISLADLYPHLYPLDADMPALKERLMKEKDEREKKLRGNAANNALANAAALPDDTVPAPVARLRESDGKPSSKAESERGTPARGEEEAKEKLPEPADQKTHLLRSLLCIGAIPEALYILGRFPWLLEVYPDLHPYIHRLLHHSLKKVYEWAQPLSKEENSVSSKKTPTEDAPSLKPTDFTPRKTLRWAKLEQTDAGDGIDYRFYWEDWIDNVPVCQSVDDVFELCKSLLSLIGVEFGLDAGLVAKMARIGSKSLTEDSSESNRKRWTDISMTLLAPSLSFTTQNPGVVNEMWDLFKQFDTETRYTIYTEWFTGRISRLPAVQSQFRLVEYDTKYILRRISKENVVPMARSLAKSAYTSPGIVFRFSLKQAEEYPNIIPVLVGCSRYFTLLAYDCLNWALIKTLSEQDRERVQGDGMLTSRWLQSIADFSGQVYKRYTYMSPTPLLQFVTDQLVRGSPTILEILKAMIFSMAGIDTGMDLNEAQMQAMSAGVAMRSHYLKTQLNDTRHKNSSSGTRLIKCLVDTGLAPQLLIAIAQELELYFSRPANSNAPLKVLGENMDTIHHIFFQYLDLLRSNLDFDDFDATIPDLVSLISDFHVDPSLAFTISRAGIKHNIRQEELEKDKAEEDEKAAKARAAETEKTEAESPQGENQTNTGEDDVKMEETQSQVNGEVIKPNTTSEDVEMVEETSGTAQSPTADSPEISDPQFNRWSSAIISSLAERLQLVMPESFEHFSALFYVTFWQLSLGDLVHPGKTYIDLVKKYNADASKLQAVRIPNVKAIQPLLDEGVKFQREYDETLKATMASGKRLRAGHKLWFAGIPMVDSRSEALYDAILERCFLPRIMLSQQDAHFTFVMLKHLHGYGVPGFRTMKFLDQFFKQKQLANIIFMCTPKEANNLGYFLNEVLKELNSWHSKKEVYLQQAIGPNKKLPGFGRTFNPDRSPATFLDYEDFRRVLYKWHSQMFRALGDGLKSGQYMSIRNAIMITKAVIKNFPVVDFMGKALQSQINSLADTEPRADLKLSANALRGDINKREPSWMISQEFHINKAALSAPRTASRRNSQQPATPQPSTATASKPLNAAAPDFAPNTATTNGILNQFGSTKDEHEDGEVDDEKKSEASAATQMQQFKNQEVSQPLTDTPAEKPTATPLLKDTEMKDVPTMQGNEVRASGESATPAPSANTASRPDSRGSATQPNTGRVPHALPTRPDTQGPRGRIPDRLGDRPSDYHGHGRHDGRNNANPEYGRLDRPGDNMRPPFQDRREPSPGHRVRGRTPDRGAPLERDRRDPGWGGRDPRDYPDDRSRQPPRDIRGPPGARGPGWGDSPRDSRDSRDLRDRPIDPRGPPAATAMDRSRLHGGPPMVSPNDNLYRGQNADRPGHLAPRPHSDRPPANPSTTLERPTSSDRSMVNPERAALIEGGDRGRMDNLRNERDIRRERGSRPQSPRRGDERPPMPYPNRNDILRDHRDDRSGPPDRLPYPSGRDRRDDASGNAPTGPRGGRNDFTEASAPNRVTREMFQPQPPRPQVDPNHGRLSQDFAPPARPQAQDPNYGRLNPSDNGIPSGPRGRNAGGRGGRNFTGPAQGPSRAGDATQIPTSPAADRPPAGPLSDRRDHNRRESASFDQNRSSAPSTPAAEKPAQDLSGIHPSRLNMVQAPPIQTDLPPGPPSGPRGSARTPHGPLSSPSTRGPPTGPANAPDRGSRREDKSFARTINSVLTQNAPNAPAGSHDRNAPDRGASIRGRASRGNELSNAPPGNGGSHPGTPNPHSRPEHLSNRAEASSQDDGRSDSRSRRDGRRSERKHRSRSPHGDKKADERGPRNEEIENQRPGDRGSGREKRGPGNEREPSRRERGDRERDGERPAREQRDRRDRGPRDDGRGPGRADEPLPRRGGQPMTEVEPPMWGGENRGPPIARNGEPRMRGGDGRRDDRERRGPRDDGRDGRKRGRGGEEGPPHGDNKRPRRSEN